MAQEGPLGQLLLLTCTYPGGGHQPGVQLRPALHSHLLLKSLLSGDFQPMAMLLSPGQGLGRPGHWLASGGGSSSGPHGSWASHFRQSLWKRGGEGGRAGAEATFA